MVSLDQLSKGSAALIQEVRADSDDFQRLMAMGVMPGSQVRFIKHAPLGDPIAIEIDGRQLSLRRKEASAIMVLPQ